MKKHWNKFHTWEVKCAGWTGQIPEQFIVVANTKWKFHKQWIRLRRKSGKQWSFTDGRLGYICRPPVFADRFVGFKMLKRKPELPLNRIP